MLLTTASIGGWDVVSLNDTIFCSRPSAKGGTVPRDMLGMYGNSIPQGKLVILLTRDSENSLSKGTVSLCTEMLERKLQTLQNVVSMIRKV